MANLFGTVFIGCTSIRLRIVVALAFLFAGCTREVFTDITPPIAEHKEFSIDVGVVTGNVVASCDLAGMTGIHEVKKIVASCGCTTPDIGEGDTIDLEDPFNVTIDTSGKSPGPASQRVIITLGDNLVLDISIAYVFQPLPYSTPEYLVLEREAPKTVALHFPGEDSIQIQSVQVPRGVEYRVVNEKRAKNEPAGGDGVSRGTVHTLNVEFVLNGNFLQSECEGVLEIMVNSERRPKMLIPYLLLANHSL